MTIHDMMIANATFEIPFPKGVRLITKTFDPIRIEYGSDNGLGLLSQSLEIPKIRSVTINDKKKITTVVFTDGDVKMVKCGKNDTYSPEMGIVYCMALKYSGLSKTQFKKMIDKFIPKEKEG